MSASIDIADPSHPKKDLLVAANPATSSQTGWPVGFWWAELTHSACKPFAVRDGNPITGQQQYSGAAAARLVIETLGV